jgi:hypothetical protein
MMEKLACLISLSRPAAPISKALSKVSSGLTHLRLAKEA